MIIAAVELFARIVVVIALVYASAVGLTHWAVRSRHLNPFGAWPRFVRRLSDPVLLPLERRVIRAGGSPQDAPLWLVGIVIAGGLLLLSLVHWLAGLALTIRMLASSGPRAWVYFVVSGCFSLLMAALFIRVIASWLGVSPYHRWMRPVMALTNWLIEPIRRVVPPFGMFDLSPLVAWVVLLVARGLVLSFI